MSPDRFRVVRAYRSAYPDPLTARKGERLRLEWRESEWPGWVWGQTQAGGEGWVPESWLVVRKTSGFLLRDYTARELTVEAGTVLTAEWEESGWIWATDGDGGTGWVPLENLVTLDP